MALAALALAAAACGSDGAGSATTASGASRPTIVVSTSVWGDVVGAAFGDVADVEVLIPVGADPHDFAPSARQAEQMEDADLLVVNGLGLEAGMTDLIARVEEGGTPVVELAATIATIEGEGGAADPHVWMDPIRVGQAIEALGAELGDRMAVGRPAIEAATTAYVDGLTALDARIDDTLASIPSERRLLVTNHDSFAYFADRYGFEVVGTVLPSNNTSASASAADLVELAALIREFGVPAIFAETTESDQLAQALADEVGDHVAVVELYTGSLGAPGSGADTYAGLMTTNAARIADALTADPATGP